MSRSVMTLAMVLGLCAAPAAALAGFDPAQQPAQARGEDSVLTGDPNRRVCKSVTVTGSRLGKTKVCKTAREWADQTVQTRQNLERSQNQGALKGN